MREYYENFRFWFQVMFFPGNYPALTFSLLSALPYPIDKLPQFLQKCNEMLKSNTNPPKTLTADGTAGIPLYRRKGLETLRSALPATKTCFRMKIQSRKEDLKGQTVAVSISPLSSHDSQSIVRVNHKRGCFEHCRL